MTEEVSFEIPGAAVGKGRPRAFRMGKGIRMHTPEKTQSYEALVKLCAAKAMTGRKPFDGPVLVSIEIRCAIPESWSKKRQAEAERGLVLPITKPDLDNVAKAIADACNGIVYGDDKQIVSLCVDKWYGRSPMASVVVSGVSSVGIDALQDLREARDAIDRAIQMEEARQ